MTGKVIKQLSNTRVIEMNKTMGDTDISNIADGTATGAISELGSSLIETGNTNEDEMNLADKINAIYKAMCTSGGGN